MAQVITIHPDGGISGLQRKAGQGLDLRQFGRASIERVSEVVWVKYQQKWMVRILLGPFSGKRLTRKLWASVGAARDDLVRDCEPHGWGVLLFKEYDDAVAAEVEFLDAARLRGRF